MVLSSEFRVLNLLITDHPILTTSLRVLKRFQVRLKWLKGLKEFNTEEEPTGDDPINVFYFLIVIYY